MMISDFLFTDNFLSSAKKHFDILLFESTFDEKDGSFIGAIAHHTRENKSILLVVSKTPVDTIFPLIQSGKAKTILINSSSGTAGFSNKGFWDVRDISKARDFGLQVFEPIYQEQIVDFFDTETSCYIRVNEHIPFKEQIPNISKISSTFISFQEYGYSGSNGTIICFGSLLVDTLYGAGYLQEEGNAMDVFACSTPFFTIKDTLKESLQRTENLVVIIDQHLGSLYEIWIKAMLCDAGLHTISVRFISPYYQNISSFSSEYIYEQAQVDGFSIKSRILK